MNWVNGGLRYAGIAVLYVVGVVLLLAGYLLLLCVGIMLIEGKMP